MTPAHKEAIVNLRRQGLGYKKIAKHLQLSVNTIKSFCQRHGIKQGVSEGNACLENYCLSCGHPLSQVTGRKVKRFCTSQCRLKWWNAHLDLVKRQAYTTHECHYCHTAFESYGNSKRKYCSHSCYIADRFGGGEG